MIIDAVKREIEQIEKKKRCFIDLIYSKYSLLVKYTKKINGV